jgi:hypothetical protein
VRAENERASPKSHTLTKQSLLSSMLLGCESSVRRAGKKAVTLDVPVAGSYLHISMEHSGRVHVFQRLEKLVHNVLLVHFFKYICANDSVQIGIHKFENEVDVSVIVCFQDVPKFNNIFVIIKFLIITHVLLWSTLHALSIDKDIPEDSNTCKNIISLKVLWASVAF